MPLNHRHTRRRPLPSPHLAQHNRELIDVVGGGGAAGTVATFNNEYTLIDGVVPANPGHQQWRVLVDCIARKPVHQRFGRVHERTAAAAQRPTPG